MDRRQQDNLLELAQHQSFGGDQPIKLHVAEDVDQPT